MRTKSIMRRLIKCALFVALTSLLLESDNVFAQDDRRSQVVKMPWVEMDAPQTDDSVCVTDNGSGSAVAVFLTGRDNNIYYNSINLVNGTALSTWQKTALGTARNDFFDSPVACAVLNGEFYLFARTRKLSDGYVSIAADTIYTAHTTNGQRNWSNWTPIPGGGTTNSAMTAITYGNTINLFRKDRNGKLNQNVFSNNIWSGWSLIDNSFVSYEGVSAVILKDTLYLFAVKLQDKQIYMNLRKLNNASWSGWENVSGGKRFHTDVAAMSANNQIRLFGISYGESLSGPIMENFYTPPKFLPIGTNGSLQKIPASWKGWNILPQPKIGTLITSYSPSVSANAPSSAASAKKAVFVVTNGKIYMLLLEN